MCSYQQIKSQLTKIMTTPSLRFFKFYQRIMIPCATGFTLEWDLIKEPLEVDEWNLGGVVQFDRKWSFEWEESTLYRLEWREYGEDKVLVSPATYPKRKY